MENRQRENYKLESLDNYELENSDQDLRGQTLTTPDGKSIGRVEDMLVDTSRERICALRLEDDRVIDVDHVDIRDGSPVLLVPQERIPQPGPDFDRSNVTTKHIPIVEERLEVGKRPVETGKVRIRTRTESEPVSKTVNLHDERIDVDRRGE
jgi:sporulation protein YlmC with PRC-barrel domain